jgi:hypothetical protein
MFALGLMGVLVLSTVSNAALALGTDAAASSKPVCSNAGPPPGIAGASHPNDGVPDPAGRIVFGRLTRVDDVKGQIVSIDAVDPDGSDLVQLLDCETARPRFSPDGSRLAFAMVMDDRSFQVATMAADGSDLRILTDTPGYAETPDWSPDGSWLIYSFMPLACLDFNACVADGNLWTLWRMNADGPDQRLIGNPDTFDWEPRLSPDGSQVVFTRFDFAREGGEVVGDPDHAGFKPVYAPDGSGIAFGSEQGLERMDADGSNVVMLYSEPGVEINHFDWGVVPKRDD